MTAGNMPGRTAAAAVIAAAALVLAGVSAAPAARASACTVQLGHNCGPYKDPAIPMSNGYNTYVSDQRTGVNPGTAQTLTATAPESWSVTASDVPYGYTGVQAWAADTQQANDWNGSGWGNCAGTCTKVPLAALSALSVSYSESSSQRDASTIDEFAADIWSTYARDVMFWTDVQGRCNPGAYGRTILGTAVFGGQTWTVNRYGGPGSEIIFVLDADPAVPDSCSQQASGTIDVLAGFSWLISDGIVASPASIGIMGLGWEIASADGTTFTVSDFTVTATAATAGAPASGPAA
jgi:hypothetical protein